MGVRYSCSRRVLQFDCLTSYVVRLSFTQLIQRITVMTYQTDKTLKHQPHVQPLTQSLDSRYETIS